MPPRRPADLPENQVTDQAGYLGHRPSRRDLLRGVGAVSATALTTALFHRLLSVKQAVRRGRRLSPILKSDLSLPAAGPERLTPYQFVTSYNNFYELGTDKYSPAKNGDHLRPRPWTVTVEGAVRYKKTYDIDTLLHLSPLQERIYRLRCVEGWSMVIPWVGFPLCDLIKQVEPQSDARYVEFRTLLDPEQLPEERRDVLPWPYKEALRIDEALHPLTLLCVGVYGEVLPAQNGAPLRLVVPWKYGFKSIKSIVSIRFTKSQPITAWMAAAPDEYGFYANVNPDVRHPRWSQARERRLGEMGKRPTLLFNGYGEQVAQLYAGQDLRRDY